jgi:hypothetical protein
MGAAELLGAAFPKTLTSGDSYEKKLLALHFCVCAAGEFGLRTGEM